MRWNDNNIYLQDNPRVLPSSMTFFVINIFEMNFNMFQTLHRRNKTLYH